MKLNDENKDESNIPEFKKPLNFQSKMHKFQINKSTIPNNLKKDEKKLTEDLIKLYNDPKMRTKTLPENFNIDCLRYLDSSIERLPKKSQNVNICFKSIEDFSAIKTKMKKNDNIEKVHEIQELEMFFGKKKELVEGNSHIKNNLKNEKTRQNNEFITDRNKPNQNELSQNFGALGSRMATKGRPSLKEK